MWNVQYKRHNASQVWSVLGSYENEERAINHASQALDYYFMVKVMGPDGNIVWSNETPLDVTLH